MNYYELHPLTLLLVDQMPSSARLKGIPTAIGKGTAAVWGIAGHRHSDFCYPKRDHVVLQRTKYLLPYTGISLGMLMTVNDM